MNIKEIQALNCKTLIPTGWNIYEWSEKHPDTTIAHSLKRMEKIMDFSDAIQIGTSGGKDSSVSGNLACLELNLRRLRLKYGIMRDGTTGIDPLDLKWKGKRIHSCSTNAEVVFTDTNNYIRRFLKKYGPEKWFSINGTEYKWNNSIETDSGKMTALSIFDSLSDGNSLSCNGVKLNEENCFQTGGFDLLEHNEICLPLAWQSGVNFDSGILISWDPNKESQWVQPMPTKEELHGFDCVKIDNLDRSNPVPLDSLSLEAQKYHLENGNTFDCPFRDLFSPFAVDSDDLTIAVSNYGRGPMLQNFAIGTHEKNEQDDYSFYFAQTTWLVDDRDEEQIKACQERLKSLYDLTYDVWNFTENEVYEKIEDKRSRQRVSTALISLRAEESLDRRVILTQGEYSTGQYSNNQGTNICSPVFDFTTADIWRLLSATDWDVNETYEKLYEIGVGIGDQRVGSLLNYAAVRQIGTVKALEPDLYGRINGRFQNVEFMAQFNRSGYFKIGKPKDTYWDGHNHIKAGYEPEEVKALSDRYENLLIKLNIPYERDGNEFKTADPALKGKPWYPLNSWLKEHKDEFNSIKE